MDGLHAPEKRVFTFKHLLQEGHDIIALQETHCWNNDMNLWGKGMARPFEMEYLFHEINNRYSNGF